MNQDTEKEIEEAIVACAKKAQDISSADEALKYTQAAQNAANALEIVKAMS